MIILFINLLKNNNRIITLNTKKILLEKVSLHLVLIYQKVKTYSQLIEHQLLTDKVNKSISHFKL